jgi:hypothetical protein
MGIAMWKNRRIIISIAKQNGFAKQGGKVGSVFFWNEFYDFLHDWGLACKN